MVFRRRDVKCLCFPAWPIDYILKRNGKKWEIPTLPCSCWKSPRNLKYWVGAGLCWSSLRHFVKPAFLKREILNAILPADNPPSLSPHLWQHLPCGGGRTLKLLVHCSVSPSTGAGWAGIGLRVRSPGSAGVAADTASPGQRSPARAGVQVGRCLHRYLMMYLHMMCCRSHQMLCCCSFSYLLPWGYEKCNEGICLLRRL